MRCSPAAVCLAGIGLSLLVFASPAARADDPLQAGAAAVAISPPAGTPMAGYYSERAAEGVHDDLMARALVLDSGGTRVALVVLDLIAAPRDLVEESRAAIEATTSIPAAHVMISATHSHTGPVLWSSNARNGALSDAGADAARSYRATLPGKIAESVKQAAAKLQPARTLVAHGREASIAFNRRFHMADGSVGWNPGKKNPAIVKPAGPIDPDVPIVCLETAAADRKPIAAYVNYAVHLDNIGGAQISADLPGVLARTMAQVKGEEMVTLWSAGCCGDINHIDVTSAERQGGFDNAARMGVILAAEVLRTWPRLEPVASGPLRVRSATVKLALPPVSEQDLATAKATLERRNTAGEKPPTFLETVKAFQVLDVAAKKGEPTEAEVQVIALGRDVAWVSLPGEIFVELGLAIKQDSPFATTIPVELANGLLGYVPTRRAYAQGNYEVVSARVAEGSGEELVATAAKLLRELYAEAPSK